MKENFCLSSTQKGCCSKPPRLRKENCSGCRAPLLIYKYYKAPQYKAPQE